MESREHLDRSLEALPTDAELAERSSRNVALTRPELAALAAFAKMHIKKALNDNDIGTDPLIRTEIFHAFPRVLETRFREAMLDHRLAREIVSTQLANDLVHHMGITFATHLMEFVGATVDEVLRAWLAMAGIFRIRERFRRIEAIAGIGEELRLDALAELVRLGRRATRWLLRHERPGLDVAGLIDRYGAAIDQAPSPLPVLLGQSNWQAREARIAELAEAGIDANAADDLTPSADLALMLTITAAAKRCGAQPAILAGTFAELGRALDLDWLIVQLAGLPHASHWQAMERDSLIDDMVMVQSQLTADVHTNAAGDVAGWLESHAELRDSWHRAMEETRHANLQDFSLFSVTCRKLLDLGRSC
jgi:glutamate dehydrogenase